MAKKKVVRKRVSAPSAAHIKELPDFVLEQVLGPSSRAKRRAKAAPAASRQRLEEAGGSGESASRQILQAAESISPNAAVPEKTLPADIRATTRALEQQGHRFHGAKINLAWFPWRQLASPCADKFGYLTPTLIRNATRLPFDAPTMELLDKLGAADGRSRAARRRPIRRFPRDSPMSASSSTTTSRSTCPRGSTSPTDAKTVNNMRTPALDLDSVYGDGPALDAFLYAFPTAGPPTAIKLQLGSNTNTGPGGPAGTAGRRRR